MRPCHIGVRIMKLFQASLYTQAKLRAQLSPRMCLAWRSKPPSHISCSQELTRLAVPMSTCLIAVSLLKTTLACIIRS